MRHKLILDFGNTLKKLAVFKGNEQIEFQTSTDDVIQLIEDFRRKYPELKWAILSSVINIDLHLMNYLKIHFKFIHFNHETPIPVKNKYLSPQTLGHDRLAAAVGAHLLFPSENVLVIDAGSSITYELLTKKGEYLGGAISPGLKMRALALKQFTDQLPKVELPTETPLVGNDTQSSIKSGVLNGMIAEINGMIEAFMNPYSELKIILTGGDVYYFEKSLKYNIFASENLVLKGLNNIIDYNEL